MLPTNKYDFKYLIRTHQSLYINLPISDYYITGRNLIIFIIALYIVKLLLLFRIIFLCV